MIAIVDYGMGNLASVYKALRFIGTDAIITDNPENIRLASGLIVPGVGAFIPAMEKLKILGLDEEIKAFAKTGKPVLGICLGMQLLLSDSYEGVLDGKATPGLNLIPGHVIKFPEDKTTKVGLKVPQMGWNTLTDVKGKLLTEGDYVYFVHSFYCKPDSSEDTAAYATYGIKYAAAVEKDNIFGCQFHPEKSGEAGLQILEKFVRRVEK